MKTVMPELHVENCKQALDFYRDVFGGELRNVQSADGKALRQGGTTVFELQKTFWGACHAVVTDRYGVTWGLNYTIR